MFNGSELNQCLHALTADKTGDYWRGPILIYGTPKVVVSESVADLGTGDLTLALRGFVEYHQKMQDPLVWSLKPKPRTSFDGVVISIKNVDGSRKVVFTETKIPVAHPICGKDREVSQICANFGANLLTYTYSEPSDGPREVPDDGVSTSAAFLHIETARGKHYGHINPSWKGINNDVLVVNSRGKALRAYEVEAACKYIETVLMPRLQQSGTSSNEAKKVLGAMDEKAWQKFLASFEKEHAAGAEGIHEKLNSVRLTAPDAQQDGDKA